MRLSIVPGLYAIARLPATALLPSWASGTFVSVTRTPDELSVICADQFVPGDVPAEHGFRCLAVEGPIPFETIGIAAGITTALAAASISVFLVATYDTDYVLVRADAFERAWEALRAAGHEVATTPVQSG